MNIYNRTTGITLVVGALLCRCPMTGKDGIFMHGLLANERHLLQTATKMINVNRLTVHYMLSGRRSVHQIPIAPNTAPTSDKTPRFPPSCLE